jgi:hypothetical protein
MDIVGVDAMTALAGTFKQSRKNMYVKKIKEWIYWMS